MEQSGQSNSQWNDEVVREIVESISQLQANQENSKFANPLRKGRLKLIQGAFEYEQFTQAVEKIYKSAREKYYIKFGRRIAHGPQLLDRMLRNFFDESGMLAGQVYYTNKLLGNSIIEAFYMELKRIRAERTYRKTLLDILAENGQKRSDLYAKISNDKTTRG